jgi:hemerythrin-like domain-containing protein
MSLSGKPDTREMHAVHTVFRREFALMPELIRGVKAGDSERAKIVADHITLMVTFLHHHHHAEDENLWPRLLARAPKDCDPIIQLMERQHTAIAERLDDIEVALGFWRTSDARDASSTLAVSVNGVLIPLFEHLGLEEERILPLAEQYITVIEWDTMAEAAARGLQENMVLVLGMIVYEGDPDVIQALLARLAGADAPVLRAAATQAFEAHAQSVYGTATPPRSALLRPAV